MRASLRPIRAALVSHRPGRVVLSTEDLDRGGETYVSIITKILAAIVALLWGASLMLAGVLGVKPGTSVGNVAAGVGAILVLLAVDQLWREFRRLQ